MKSHPWKQEIKDPWSSLGSILAFSESLRLVRVAISIKAGVTFGEQYPVLSPLASTCMNMYTRACEHWNVCTHE